MSKTLTFGVRHAMCVLTLLVGGGCIAPSQPLVRAQADLDAKVAAGMSSIDERVEQIESTLSVVSSQVDKMAGRDIDERKTWNYRDRLMTAGVIVVLVVLVVLGYRRHKKSQDTIATMLHALVKAKVKQLRHADHGHDADTVDDFVRRATGDYP